MTPRTWAELVDEYSNKTGWDVAALMLAMDVAQIHGWAEERAVALTAGEPYRATMVGFPKD